MQYWLVSILNFDLRHLSPSMWCIYRSLTEKVSHPSLQNNIIWDFFLCAYQTKICESFHFPENLLHSHAYETDETIGGIWFSLQENERNVSLVFLHTLVLLLCLH